MSESVFLRVASEADLKLGKMLCVQLADREILLARTAEGVFAVDNLCSHAAERLSNGKLKGYQIFCPLHGASFDVRSGAALSRPASQALSAYPVKLEAGEILLCFAPTED